MRGLAGVAALSGVLLGSGAVSVELALAQSCTWDLSADTPPSATHLRAYREILRAPGRLAVGPTGRLYIAEPRMGQVLVRDAQGRLVTAMGGFEDPLGLAVDAVGRVYVSEEHRGRVAVFDARWNALWTLGAGEGEFLRPNDVAVDPVTGEVYVVDGGHHDVRVYSPAGTLLRVLGSYGVAAGQFDFPVAVHVSPLGEVFVGDQSNDRVQVFERDGTFLRCFGKRGLSSFSRRFGRIQALTGDATGRIYVADAFQGEVRVFDRWGGRLGAIGSFGEGPGQLRTPAGLAIDPYNRLFVASANTGRIEVFGIDDFSDPRLVPIVVDVDPRTLQRSSGRRWVTAYLELPEGIAGDILPTSLKANGVPAEPSPVSTDDRDRDGVPDLMVKFDARALLGTLPDGEAIVVVSGALADGTPIEGASTVRVLDQKGAP